MTVLERSKAARAQLLNEIDILMSHVVKAQAEGKDERAASILRRVIERAENVEILTGYINKFDR